MKIKLYPALRHLFGARLIKNSSIYMVIAFMQKAIGFFLLPVYTIFLTPNDYGKVNVVNTLMGVVSVFYNLSLQGAAIRFHFKYQEEKVQQKKLWGTTFSFVFINSLVLSVLLSVFHKTLLDPFATNISFSPFLLLGLITTGLSPTFMYYQAFLQAEQKGKSYGINNLVFFLINITLTIIFVVGYKLGAVGILMANAITNGVFFGYSLFRLIPQIVVGFDKTLLVESLKYALPLMPYNLTAFAALMIDRLFINNLKGTSDVGLYSVGYQFANITNIITGAIAQAYAPWFFKKWEEGVEGKAKITAILPVASLLFAGLGLGIALFGPLILSVMVSSSFASAWQVIPCMAIGYAIFGTYLLASNGLFVSKTYLLPIFSFVGLAVNIIANILIIPRYGIVGASVSSLCSNISMSVLVVFIAERVEHLAYKKARIFGPFILVIPASMLAFPLHSHGAYLKIGGSILVFSVVVCLLISGNIKSLKVALREFSTKSIANNS